MALSLSNFLYLCCGFFLLSFAAAETRTYDFTVGWLYRNPDGLHTRPVIGINGEWPIPRIEASVGDRIVVNLHNNLGNQSTSLHFHGLFMNGTNEMDGVVGVTQCGIPPGSSFTYDFTVSTQRSDSLYMTDNCRSTNLVPTGTTPTMMGSIQMAFAGLLLFMIQNLLTRASMTKSWYSPSQIGITRKCSS